MVTSGLQLSYLRGFLPTPPVPKPTPLGQSQDFRAALALPQRRKDAATRQLHLGAVKDHHERSSKHHRTIIKSSSNRHESTINQLVNHH